MSKCRLAALLGLAFLVGVVVQSWRMVRMPIDEYHDVRMEVEKRLDELNRELERSGRR